MLLTKSKTALFITLGIGTLVLVVVAGMFIGVTNNAITYEENIFEQKSAIDVQLKRRSDLIKSLVSTVEESAQFEGDTLARVIEARKQANAGNIEEAKLSIQAVAEAYPTLKTTDSYANLMLELATTENLISNQRKTYNTSIREYNQFVRVFPNSLILGISGYEKQEYTYLEFNTDDYDPAIFD